MTGIKASIVIPVYNGQAYLAETLKSCLSQSFGHIEIIVVNDGSNDSTGKILKYFSDKDARIHAITQSNAGRSIARNVGMEQAKGDFIFAMDADDICDVKRVKNTLKVFRNKPEIDIVYGDFQIVDAYGKYQGKSTAVPYDFEKTKSTLLNYIGHCTMAFRRKVIGKVSYTDGPYSANAIDDWKFQVDAHKAGFSFYPVNRILAQYRWIQKERDEAKIKELKLACLN